MDFDTQFFIDTFFKLFDGIGVTLSLTILSLVIGFIPAFAIAVYRQNHTKGFIISLIKLLLNFVRGTPLVLQLLLIYSLLPSILNIIVKKLGLEINIFDVLNPYYYALLVFSVLAMAQLSEILRSALFSIDKGQYEAAKCAALSPLATYIHVIIPQALVSALPNISNLAVGLVKGTALAFAVEVKDILAIAKIEAAFGYTYIEAYLDVFIMYLLICSVIQILFALVEKRVSRFKLA